MINLTPIQEKIATVRSMVDANSITPEVLANLLNDLVDVVSLVDTSVGEVVRTASVKRVALFSQFVDGITLQVSPTTKTPASDGCSVVYDVVTNCFALSESSSLNAKNYYSVFEGCYTFGTTAEKGLIPHADTLYICAGTAELYRYDGISLKKIGSSLSVGSGEKDAYSGAAGTTLRADVDDMLYALDLQDEELKTLRINIDNTIHTIATHSELLAALQNIAASVSAISTTRFAEFVENTSVSTGKSEASSTTTNYDVVFDRTGKRFLLRRKISTGDTGGTGGGTISPDFDLTEPLVGPELTPGLTQYWADWADRDRFTLNAGRVYICEAESALYTYNGTTLVPADRSAVAVAELTQAVTANKNACDAALAASSATTNTLRADVDAASSKANRASLDASNALTAASVATQSINAALEKANDAAKDAADAGRRIDALESATHYEELASEAEWQARKTAGTLSPDKLYYIAEA